MVQPSCLVRRALRPVVITLVAASSGAAVRAQTAWTDTTTAWNAAVPIAPSPYFGRGSAVEDFNGDGRLDIVTGDGTVGGVITLLLGQVGGGFVQVANPGLGLTDELKGLAAADYDNDGDLDLLVCRRMADFSLYANNGVGQFADVTVAAGIVPPAAGAESFGCTWTDYDVDGKLDFVIARRFNLPGTNPPVPGPNLLYRQSGAGTFTMVPNAAGSAGQFLTFLVDACDFDDDGDPDLLSCDDFGGQYPFAGLGQVLWRNDGGLFVDMTAAYGVTTPVAAMGCAWGDVDRDGDFDYFLTNDPRGHVFGVNQLSTGGGFPDLATLWGVFAGEVGWGCAFFDYDADGFSDLYVAQSAGSPSRLFRNNAGVPPMTDVAPSLGLALTMATDTPDVVAADFDDDGDLDLYETLAPPGGRLMLNPGLGTAHWLKVKLVGVRSNRSAIGARVKVMGGGAPRIDAVRGRAGYLSSGPLATYHGLGAATVADLVEIRWPNGAWTSRAGPIAANQTLSVVEPAITTPAVWNLGTIKQVQFDAPGDAGMVGVVLLSLNPTPAPLGDGRFLPFTFDDLTWITAAAGNPLMGNNVVVLPGSANMTAYVYIPAAPFLSGLSVHVAGGTTDPAAPLGIRSLTSRTTVVLQ
jgi:enediyne biosynthesis protein E4